MSMREYFESVLSFLRVCGVYARLSEGEARYLG